MFKNYIFSIFFLCFIFCVSGEDFKKDNPVCAITPDQRSIYLACLAPFIPKPYLKEITEFVQCAEVPSFLHAIELLCLLDNDAPEVKVIQECFAEREGLLNLNLDEEVVRQCSDEALKYKEIEDLMEEEGDK
ncbi:uncharacterized protein LOC111620795 [Centruroides sculpturatus]|uniref:uncharacterized protein LOC111620795 n=1 Tax=Centruroides sculpturatus TaxID=218467 RepID=UPI000C6DC44A|nr:uncharacterized protein LOC111620795 [Centruroides sculpturatus]